MSDKLTNEEQFNEYWNDAVGKSPYTHAKAIAKHAWDAGQAKANAQGEAVAWIRFCSDGSYEGPIMDCAMEDVRKKSGAWTPLYAHPPMPQLDGRYAPESFPTKFAEPSTALPDEPQQWLCEAWGETELPLARICANRAEVERFFVDEWIGDKDSDELPPVMMRFDEHDWDDDNKLDWEFEIGGVSVKRIWHSTTLIESDLRAHMGRK